MPTVSRDPLPTSSPSVPFCGHAEVKVQLIVQEIQYKFWSSIHEFWKTEELLKLLTHQPLKFFFFLGLWSGTVQTRWGSKWARGLLSSTHQNSNSSPSCRHCFGYLETTDTQAHAYLASYKTQSLIHILTGMNKEVPNCSWRLWVKHQELPHTTKHLRCFVMLGFWLDLLGSADPRADTYFPFQKLYSAKDSSTTLTGRWRAIWDKETDCPEIFSFHSAYFSQNIIVCFFMHSQKL